MNRKKEYLFIGACAFISCILADCICEFIIKREEFLINLIVYLVIYIALFSLYKYFKKKSDL